MKETGVLFNTDMVKAEREDRKTQTRRLDGLKKVNENPDEWEVFDIFVTETASRAKNAHDVTVASLKNKETNVASLFECPFGVIGDRLWVRETFRESVKGSTNFKGYRDCIEYKAGGIKYVDYDCCVSGKWKPSIHMPRWACRTILEITDIRVERVQDISEVDAKAEGMLYLDGLGVGHSGYRHSIDHEYVYDTAKAAFRILWDSVYEKRGLGWNKNPFVWVITFKRVEG